MWHDAKKWSKVEARVRDNNDRYPMRSRGVIRVLVKVRSKVKGSNAKVKIKVKEPMSTAPTRRDASGGVDLFHEPTQEGGGLSTSVPLLALLNNYC